MRYAILGDLHANLTALEAVLDEIALLDIDRILSVGDVIGYGAAPCETIDLVREASVLPVMGNHDSAIASDVDPCWFNPMARQAVAWSRAQLSRDQRKWLSELPLVEELEHCTLAHATLDHPERFDYIQRPSDADGSLDQLEGRICFVGHTHVPVVILRDEESGGLTRYTVDREVDLSDCKAAVINAGSVGQPRDEDPRAAFGIYDTENSLYSLRRLEYDIERESARILAAGLPEMLADRLHLGI